MTPREIAIGNRRLLKLADFLQTVPRKHFDYSRWVDIDSWEGKEDLSCGTQACALGWATTMPAFRRLGLRLRPATVMGDAGYNIHYMGTPYMSSPEDGEVDGTYAAMELFHLDYSEAYYLFVPQDESDDETITKDEDTATPKYVARKIRKFVNKRQASLKQTQKFIRAAEKRHGVVRHG